MVQAGSGQGPGGGPTVRRSQVGRLRRRARQADDQQQEGDAAGSQGHPLGIGLEADDGLNAPGDVFAAVGDGSGARGTRVLLVGHGQQADAVRTALLPCQALQHPLVTQGLQVVAHPVQKQVDQGVAPVDGPAEGPKDILQGVVIFHMEQLVEEHMVLHLLPRRQGQHRTENPADHGRGQAGQDHHRAKGQAVLLCHPHHLAAEVLRGFFSPPHETAQGEVADQIPQQKGHHAEDVEEKQPVCNAVGQAGQPGHWGLYLDCLGHRGIGRGQPFLHRQFGHLEPQRQPEQGCPAAKGGRHQQPGRQHHPDEILPPGGQLVPQQPLDHQQQHTYQGDVGGLEQKLPKIGHLIPPFPPTAAAAGPARRR